MKRIILLLALFSIGSFHVQASPEEVEPTLHLSDIVMKEIGYDWYAENFQGSCEIVLTFTINENHELALEKVDCDDPEVVQYLVRKFRNFSVSTGHKSIDNLALKLRFSAS